MTVKQNSSLGIVFILGLLAMLMPLSIDMYLPALPVISAQFNVPDGSAQMTLSTYILGFAFGQLLYGPMADSLGRKPVILGGTLVFAAAAVACALNEIAWPYPPVRGHWMGIDAAGRDVLARVLYGMRIAMIFGLLLAFWAMFFGLTLGAIQGYFGGWIDIAGQRLTEAVAQMLDVKFFHQLFRAVFTLLAAEIVTNLQHRH